MENKAEDKKVRKAWGWKKRFLAMFGGLLVMVAVDYLIFVMFAWAAGEMQLGGFDFFGKNGNDGVAAGDGDVVDVISDSVVYSQEEMEARVANAREQAAMELLQNIRAGLDGGDSVLQILRPLYPDELIVHSGGKYNFVPINRGLKQSVLEAAGLNVLESGEYQYVQDGQVISHKGIDVSKHQGDIDWNLVALDGVEFAFIRVGYRGYGTGKMVEDEFYEDNIKEALSAGLKVGVYFYSQAITEEEVLEEADFVLEKIAPYRIECPVVFDVERVTGSDGRMNSLSVEERTHLTQLFCQKIEGAGYRPMIYHNTEMAVMMLGLESLEAYDKWFAAYSDTFYYPYEYRVWQYSQSGTVQGINGNVDLNISIGPLW